MGTYNGEYYQDFTPKPEYSNKITNMKKVINKLGPDRVGNGLNVVVIQKNIDHKNPTITIDEYLKSVDKPEPIKYVVQSEVER